MNHLAITNIEQLHLFDERMIVGHQPPHLTLGMFFDQKPIYFQTGRASLSYIPCCCGHYDLVNSNIDTVLESGCDCGYSAYDKRKVSQEMTFVKPYVFRWLSIYPESDQVIRFSFQTTRCLILESDIIDQTYDFKKEVFQEVAYLRYHLDGTIEQENLDLLRPNWVIREANHLPQPLRKQVIEDWIRQGLPEQCAAFQNPNAQKNVMFHQTIDPAIKYLKHPVAQKHAYFHTLPRQRSKNLHEFASRFMAYHLMMEKFPQMEQVIKSGYRSIGKDWIDEFAKNPTKKFQLHRYLKEGTKLTDIMPLPKPFLKELRKRDVSYKQYQYILKVHEASPLNEPALNLLLDAYDSMDLNRLWRIVREGHAGSVELLMYLKGCQTQQGIDMKEALILWDDYYQMAQEQTLPYKKFTPTLKLAHDILARDVEKIRDEKLNQQFEERANALADLNFEDEETAYGFFVPQTAEDLIREGRVLRHCVGGYQRRFAEGKTTILFVRELSQPDKPLYTLEWNLKKKEVVQFRGYSNANVTDRTVLKCLRKWKERQA